MRIIFVRHGQTDYNKAGIVQGQEKDIPLNDEGRRQVEATVLNIPTDVDRIISSPLKRAAETAAIINTHLHKTIEYRDELKEFSFGELAGKTWPEIGEFTGDPDMHRKEEDATLDFSPYGGESAQEVKARVTKFIEEMKTVHPSETILVTAHGGIIDVMHTLFPQKERIDGINASIHVFDL